MTALSYVAVCLIWGSTWLAIKIGLDGVPPFLGAGLRFVVAVAVTAVVLVLRRQPIRLTRDDRICIVSQGILVFWFNYAAVYWAEMRISSGLTAVIFSTMPLTTAMGGTSFTTTALGATAASSPMVMPPRILEPQPRYTRSPMTGQPGRLLRVLVWPRVTPWLRVQLRPMTAWLLTTMQTRWPR